MKTLTLYCFVTFAVALLSSVSALPRAQEDLELESGGEPEQVLQAAAPDDANCDCQCNSYVWKDKSGKVHGNCKSADDIGLWCYTDSHACQDIRYSDKHTDKYGNPRKWSYQACATPPPWSPECSQGPQVQRDSDES